jgi:hypothetical protein
MSTIPTADDFGQHAPSGFHVRDSKLRFFGGFCVSAPENVFDSTVAVTHDVIVTADGAVTVQLNGTDLPDLLR